MANTNVQTQSGNRIVIEMDGKAVGLVQSIKPSDDYAHEDASGIGDIHVIEHVPTKASHSIEVSTFVMMKSHLRNVGIAPENGDRVLDGRVFDLCVYSRDTGELLRKWTGCSWTKGDLDVQAHKIIGHNGSIKALDVVGMGL